VASTQGASRAGESPHLTATPGLRQAASKAEGSRRKALPVATAIASAPGALEATGGRGEASTRPSSCRLIYRNGNQHALFSVSWLPCSLRLQVAIPGIQVMLGQAGVLQHIRKLVPVFLLEFLLDPGGTCPNPLPGIGLQ